MIRDLKKIKNAEERKKIGEKFKYNIKEYSWLSSSANPQKDIEDELRECADEIRDGMTDEEQRDMISKIHSLKAKAFAIAKGEYEPTVRNNIIGYMLMMEEYDAREQKMSFKDIVLGILKGDEQVKEHLRNKHALSLSNMYGIIPAPESFDVEKIEDILTYFDKNYDMVGIDFSDALGRKENKENALVVSSDISSGVRKWTEKSIVQIAGKLPEIALAEAVYDSNDRVEDVAYAKNEQGKVIDRKMKENGKENESRKQENGKQEKGKQKDDVGEIEQ